MPLMPVMVNWAYWWQSDSPFSWIANSFQTVKNLEVRKNPKGIKLQYAMVKDSVSVIDEEVYCMITLPTSSDVIAFGVTGNVFRKSASTWLWVKNTYDIGNKVVWAAIYTVSSVSYLWFATEAKLWTITETNASSDNWTGNVVDKSWTIPLNSTTIHPMLVRNDGLYIGNKNTVIHVDPLGIWVDKVFDLSATNELIVKITDNGSMVRAYTKKVWLQDFGRCYYFNPTASSPQETQSFDSVFMWSVRRNSVDYIIAGQEPILYYYPYQKTPLKRIPNIWANPYIYETFKDYVVMGTTGWLYVRWSLNKNYPEALTFDYWTSNAETDIVTCVHNSNWTLYVACKNAAGTSFWVDKLSTTVYQTLWTLVSKVYYSEMMLKQKDSIEWYVANKVLTWANQIKLYTKYDFASDWTLQFTATASTHTTPFLKVPVRWWWNVLETKIELVGNGTDTPEVNESYFKFSERGI